MSSPPFCFSTCGFITQSLLECIPSSTSLLDELLVATGSPDTQAPAPGAAADEGVDPALPGRFPQTPSLKSNQQVHLVWFSSPSNHNPFLAFQCLKILILKILSKFWKTGSSNVITGPGCCCCSVTQSCLTLCDPLDCSTPGLPAPCHLLEFAQVHALCIGDAVQ